MKVFIKRVRVLGLSKSDISVITNLLAEATQKGKAEKQIGTNDYLAVEISESYASSEQEHLRR